MHTFSCQEESSKLSKSVQVLVVGTGQLLSLRIGRSPISFRKVPVLHFFENWHSVRDIFCKKVPNFEKSWPTPATPKPLTIKYARARMVTVLQPCIYNWSVYFFSTHPLLKKSGKFMK